MKIIAFDVLKDGASEQDAMAQVDAELAAIWELYTEGIIRETYMRQDVMGAVFVIEADSVEAADQALQRLPLYDMLDFTLIPCGPYLPWAMLDVPPPPMP